MTPRNKTQAAFRRAMFVAILAAGSAVGGLSGAQAGSVAHDQIHEDRFGNLIVQSQSGYKRILVGRGYLAAQLGGQAYGAGERSGPSVIHYSDRDDRRDGRSWRADCNRQPVLLHGRSYMYGLDDNVVPVPAGLCD